MRRLYAPLVALAAAIALLFVGTGPASAATAASNTTTVPITGTTANGGTFTGTLSLNNITTSAGQLVANGTLSGTLTDATGAVVGTVTNQPVSMPLAVAGASCTILDLTLGPLHLDLLGLVVDLNQVHLTITAQSGSGNLLGNLLCSVAHLLDSGSLSGLSTVLNQILGLL